MASIEPKYGRDGYRTYRMTMRRHGVACKSMTFNTREEAQKFADLYEAKFFDDPENFDCDRMKLKMQRGY